jgi:hypothetical protein
MKFHQGLAGLLTLLMPVATVCYHKVTEWGVDLTPYHPVSPLKVVDDRVQHDREMAQIQHPPTERRKLLTEDDFCDGTPITLALFFVIGLTSSNSNSKPEPLTPSTFNASTANFWIHNLLSIRLMLE